MNFGALLSLITYSIFFAHYPKNLNPPQQPLLTSTELVDNQTRASRLESIKHLWNLLQTARPVDRNNPLWRAYGNTPLPPMKDGYGIQVNYQRQYEGIWKDGDLAVGVVSYPDKKYAINANFRITSEDGLNTIGDLDRYKGLPLHEILYFHELVFSQLYKCDCLIKTANHRIEEWERVEYELRDAWGVYAGTEFKNELRSRLIPGFRNNSRSDLYIRSFSRTLSEYRVNGERQMMYFDNSFMIGPNSTIRQIQFSTPLGSTQAVSSGQV
jgi:hypothetical protein